jgi:hypothetical protein
MKILFPLPLIAFLSLLVLSGCHQRAGFADADLNANGTLSQSEIGAVILDSLYKEGDTDSDGKMTYEEWKVINPDATKSQIRTRDANGDCAVSRTEIERYARRKGSFKNVFSAMDTDKSGGVTKEEAQAFSKTIQTNPWAGLIQAAQ